MHKECFLLNAVPPLTTTCGRPMLVPILPNLFSKYKMYYAQMHNKRIIIDAKLVVARMLVTAPSFLLNILFKLHVLTNTNAQNKQKNILCAVHRLQLITTSGRSV